MRKIPVPPGPRRPPGYDPGDLGCVFLGTNGRPRDAVQLLLTHGRGKVRDRRVGKGETSASPHSLLGHRAPDAASGGQGAKCGHRTASMDSG